MLRNIIFPKIVRYLPPPKKTSFLADYVIFPLLQNVIEKRNDFFIIITIINVIANITDNTMKRCKFLPFVLFLALMIDILNKCQ